VCFDYPTDRARWNQKFLHGEAQSVDPDPFLIEVCGHLKPSRALDLAGGAGRHALWLAKRDWKVTLADVADEGLAIAAERADRAGVSFDRRCESARDTLAWAQRHPFDLIVVFLCLLRDDLPALPLALSPGGLLVYKTYTSVHVRYAEGHSLSSAMLPGELSIAFPALETILARESQGIAEVVARKTPLLLHR
jgi:tellurite methyltransferase